MAHRPATPAPAKTPDPLINLGEISADAKNLRNRQGMLASFLQGSRNRESGFLSQALSQTANRTRELGNANV